MSIKKKGLSPSKAKELAKAREAAMPEVKRLVKKYGRQAVSWCVNQLFEYEKKLKQLADVKAETARLERELA